MFKFLNPRFDSTDGGLSIVSIGEDGAEYSIGTFNQDSIISEIGIPYPTGAHEYLGFKFTMTRSTTTTLAGPLFTGYQIKALPAVPRQRLIQFPLFCYDHETDHFGVESGYDGAAYDRMVALEAVENAGDIVRIEDFRTGEVFIGLIEELDFINRTPSDKRFSGFGGLLVATIRTV